MVKITVIIRSKNDAAFMERNLESLYAQTLKDFEVIHVDSGSTDGTTDIIRHLSPHAKFFQIKPDAYIPGRVCNKAVSEAQGTIVVFHNSDCIALDNNYLEQLIKPLTDGRAQVTFGNQVPRENAELWVKKDYERAFGDGSVSRHWPNFFSLASSAFLKTELQKLPFREDIQYSEDADWAFRARKRGVKIMYVPEARVEHSHNYTIEEIRKRFFNEGVADYHIYKTPLSFANMFVSLIRELMRDFAYAFKAKHLTAFPSMMHARMTQRFSTYKGRRSAYKEEKNQK